MYNYSITNYDTEEGEGVFSTLTKAYSFCVKNLKPLGLSNFIIAEHDENFDHCVSVNVAEFVFEFEENGLTDFEVFCPW